MSIVLFSPESLRQAILVGTIILVGRLGILFVAQGVEQKSDAV